MVDGQGVNNLLFPLPPALGEFERCMLAPLDLASGKRGVTAAYVGRGFSAVIAVWRPAGLDVCIEDGIGGAVAAQFAADVQSISAEGATTDVVQRTAS